MIKIKVLVVDDSALVREILSNGLNQDQDLEVIGAAGDVWRARELILKHHPDVLTLDLEMPGMDGLVFLKKLMPQYPIPVVMISALTAPGKAATFEAFENGAVDVVMKPSSNLRQGLDEMMIDLREKVKIASLVDVSRWQKTIVKKPASHERCKALEQSTDKVVVIGASTGGTVALHRIIPALPPDMAGTVVVQHMPPVFTKLFAEKLNEESQVRVAEAQDGDRIVQGKILIAPGGFQTSVYRSGGEYRLKIKEGEKVNGHAPSVDVLFFSTAENVGANALGLVLTGMGRDGAQGLLAMRKAGAKTLAQDEASSLIYGMPKEAWDCGGAEKQLSLDKIPTDLIKVLRTMTP